ncbi:putative G-protein gamma [Helianthus annuus]|nr:putative G-protein gamma [Helianthus annuus]KAJ0824803.1 putative G-protein gamma [Helianthus annuus]
MCFILILSLFPSQLYFSFLFFSNPTQHNPTHIHIHIHIHLMDSPSQPNGSSSQTQPNVVNNGHTHQTLSGLKSSNFIGKHRLAAIISQQTQQIQVIQEELDQLETLGESSLVCQQLVSSVESSTDALLPVTRGPADGGWDRWFQRANQSSSRNRKRWI